MKGVRDKCCYMYTQLLACENSDPLLAKGTHFKSLFIVACTNLRIRQITLFISCLSLEGYWSECTLIFFTGHHIVCFVSGMTHVFTRCVYFTQRTCGRTLYTSDPIIETYSYKHLLTIMTASRGPWTIQQSGLKLYPYQHL